jgi:CheY-like chemotaxis protein
MPPPDGLELVARLRAAPALKRVPAMLITSTADRDTVLRATCSDLQGFIVKPVGPGTVGRIQRVLAQLDAGILEPVETAVSRLRIDLERHARYVAAFRQQIQALTGLAQELASPAAGAHARAAFAQKADTCRTAALTLGSPRLEQLISDALALLAAEQPGAERAMGQASYWLERVAGARRR